MTTKDEMLELAERCVSEAVGQAENACNPKLTFEESEGSARFGIALLELAAALRASASHKDSNTPGE